MAKIVRQATELSHMVKREGLSFDEARALAQRIFERDADAPPTAILRFTILQRPFAWQRAENRKGGKGRRTPDEMRAMKRVIAGHGYIAMREAGLRPFEGAVAITYDFYRRGLRTAVPDVDNLEKMISDSLQGVAYKNDSQICDSHTRKHDTRDVGGIPRTVITITHAPAVVRQVPKARAS